MPIPWENNNPAPWETDFIYPRIISISRPVSALSASGGAAVANPSQTGGTVPYIGVRSTETGGETQIASGLPASIQAMGSRVVLAHDALAASAPGPIHWDIYVPLGALEKGMVLDRDIITDDEGNRYITSANYWNSNGWKLETVRLEA